MTLSRYQSDRIAFPFDRDRSTDGMVFDRIRCEAGMDAAAEDITMPFCPLARTYQPPKLPQRSSLYSF